MVWSRTILDGILLCIIFNTVVALTWTQIPCAFSSMMPKEIRQAAPKRNKRELAILAGVLYPMWILIIAYMIYSAHLAGVNGFWNLFWTGYIEMFFINLGDLFGLDYWFRGVTRDKIMIPGTENCKAWETGIWMKTLALPEHLILWPFIVCPVTGLLVAGISTWIYF